MRSISDLTMLEVGRPATPLHLRLALAMAGKLLANLGANLVAIEPVDDALDGLAPYLPQGRSAVGEFLKMGKTLVAAEGEADVTSHVAALQAGDITVALVGEGDPLIARLRAAGVAMIEIATWPANVDVALAAAPMNEFCIMAIGGILDMIGDPEREPLRLAGHQIAYAAGLSAFTAGMAAVAQRDIDGSPLHARVSLVETAVWINWKAVVGAANGGSGLSRQGRRAEFQVLPCRDGWVAFVYTPTQFHGVCAMLGSPQLAVGRFADRAGRVAQVEDLMVQVRPWFAARNREEIYAAARQHGVPLGPVYAPGELLTDEQFIARDVFTDEGFPKLPATWNGERLANAGREARVAMPGREVTA